jgi:tyrosyl-tRNA synthetase
MSHATVQQMMERDMFARRLKQEDPIGLQEFIYPLMQGYDGVAMNVDLEIGGSDQTFNMLMGRHLIKTYLNKEKFVRTNKLMEAPDGITMSKTKGNGLNLSDSAEIMYGKAMSYPDRLISAGFELLTDVPMDEIKEIEFEMTNNHVNPMQFKKKLAFEITKSILGDKEAAKAQKYFEDIYQNNVVNEDIPTIQIKDSKINILELLIKAGISKSKSDARRLIEQGAVKINNELGNGFGDGTGFGGGSSSGAGNGDGTGDGYCKIDNWEKIISTKNEVILRVGKKVIKITKHTR